MVTLVTGATGLVGNNVVRELLHRGLEVRVLVRQPHDPRPLEGLQVERFSGDVRDVEAVRAACRGVSHVVHSAARVHIGWTEWDEQRAINVDGTRHVAQAARAEGCKLIHVSSVDALGVSSRERPADEDAPHDGKIPCSYVITKREAEAAVADEIARGLEAVLINPGFMLGPWDWKPSSGRMLLAVAQRFTLIAPVGGCSVCDVRDVASAIVNACDVASPGRRYILGGANISYYELWQRLAKVTGGRSPRLRTGPLIRLLAGRSGDLAAWLTGREGDVNSAAVAMSSLFHYYDSSRAHNELNYHNRDLTTTIEDAWQWFREHGYAG